MLNYTARQTWDFELIIIDAELALDQKGIEIARAEYHAIRGSWAPSKWADTPTKIHPLIDRMLAGR